jgi:hypothetical protein
MSNIANVGNRKFQIVVGKISYKLNRKMGLTIKNE